MPHTRLISEKISNRADLCTYCSNGCRKAAVVYVRITVYSFGKNGRKCEMTDYDLMCRQLESLSGGVSWDMTVLSNAAALVWDSLDDINWAGFYLMKEGKLMLGPFQGKPACTVIEVGKGVCGTAVAEDRTQLVKNVHEYPGHIACDSASNS